MFDQVRHCQHTGMQTRIIRIDFKDNSFNDLAGIRLGTELLSCAHHDATVNCLPAGSISPSKLPYSLSASAFGLYKASILHAAPFCTGTELIKPGQGAVKYHGSHRLEGECDGKVTRECCFAAAEFKIQAGDGRHMQFAANTELRSL